MRRIGTAITAVALAFSLVASAGSANAAVPGFNSAYAGESAFLHLAPGQTGTFTVFFANTGTTSWVKGTASEVELAVCLENKTTCNTSDPAEAPYASGWVSATRYAEQSQTTVAPGELGTFTYNVTVPMTAAAGELHRFNGALVLASTGADINNQGYFQDVRVLGPVGGGGTGVAVITTVTPATGPIAGGTVVIIAGTGFDCTPFPTVLFGTVAGTVTACTATSITVTSPAGTAGTANITVTNAPTASNTVPFLYVAVAADTTAPLLTAVAGTAGSPTLTLTFNEPIFCDPANPLDLIDVIVTPTGGAAISLLSPTSTNCPTTAGTALAAITVTLASPLVAGTHPIVVQLGEARDAAGNVFTAGFTGTVVIAP